MHDKPSKKDTELWRELRGRIIAAGCENPAPLASGLHMLITLTGFLVGYAALLAEPGSAARIAAILLVAVASVQAAFINHEVGHLAVTRNRRASAALGHLFLSFMTGYANPQYQAKHRAHHAHPNDGRRDPDVSGAGLVSLHREAAAAHSGIGGWLTRHQRILIWPLVSLMPTSSKKDSLIRYFFSREAPADTVTRVVLVAHYAFWFIAPVAMLGFGDALINYIAVSLAMGPYLGAVILVNHIGARDFTGAPPVSHLRRTLLATRNFNGTRVMDYLTGGTSSHVEHHLFPLVPIWRLPVARRITREFCCEQGLPYQEMRWGEAIREVLRGLDRLSREANVASRRRAA